MEQRTLWPKFKITNPDKLFFTSDLHFGHTNILKFCNRPFLSAKEMDQALIKNWNRVVPIDGIVFLLGDMGLSIQKSNLLDSIQKLNGEKHLVLGNHDNKIIRDEFLVNEFASISLWNQVTVSIGNGCPRTHFILSHFPFESWEHQENGYIHLYGHTHRVLDTDKQIKNRLHVGVDSHNFTPLSYKEVIKIIVQKNK